MGYDTIPDLLDGLGLTRIPYSRLLLGDLVVADGHDGIAAIGALVRSGNPNALTRQGLTQPSGFVGVNGIFRLLPDGSNERGLAVAEIRNGQAVVVDPAPRSFGGFGF